jgi:hypothetical protein
MRDSVKWYGQRYFCLTCRMNTDDLRKHTDNKHFGHCISVDYIDRREGKQE